MHSAISCSLYMRLMTAPDIGTQGGPSQLIVSSMSILENLIHKSFDFNEA